MEYYDVIMRFVDVNLVYCLIPMILTLGLFNLLNNQRFQTKKALNLIRWFIVGYTILNLFHFMVGVTTMPSEYNFLFRSSGLYIAANWLVLVFATVLPFTLLNPKLGTNFLYILLVSFLMKSGAYFERLVILTTSLHRDYEPNYENPIWYNTVVFGVLIIWIQGILMGLFALWILDFINRRKTVHNKSYI